MATEYEFPIKWRTELTHSGWPRPIIGGWPIPWVSPHSKLAVMSPTRTRRVLYNKLCQVCGKKHEKGSLVYICVDGKDSYLSAEAVAFHDRYVVPMDHGIMHERCFRLALARCPKLKEKKKEGELVCVSTQIENIRLEYVTKADTKEFIVPADQCYYEEP